MNCSSGNSTCTNAGTHQHGAKWYCYPHWLALKIPVTNLEIANE